MKSYKQAHKAMFHNFVYHFDKIMPCLLWKCLKVFIYFNISETIEPKDAYEGSQASLAAQVSQLCIAFRHSYAPLLYRICSENYIFFSISET